MGDDIHKPVAIAAIVILVLVVVLVRAHALLTHSTSRGAPPRNRRPLNAGVDLVPLSGVHVQRANRGGGAATDGQFQPPPVHHHLRTVDSVTSLRYPPPAYPAHHLDPRLDGLAYRCGNIGHPVRSPVDIVPPPSYTTHPGGEHAPL